MIGIREMDKNVYLHPDMVLLRKPGLYCFFLRCKRDEAEAFMDWVVQTVLPREVRKLTSAIEEKVIALMNDDLQAIKYENVALQAQRDVYPA